MMLHCLTKISLGRFGPRSSSAALRACNYTNPIQVTQVLVITYTNIVNLLIQILVLLLRLISFHFGFLVVKFPGEKSIVNLLQIKRASYIVHDASVNVLEGLNIISLPLFEIAISRNSG